MRLLFDENLAARLAVDLVDLFPGSSSVSALAMRGATDREIWATAAIEGFALVTKDEDFHRLSVAEGHPPKVIWIRLMRPFSRSADVLRPGAGRLIQPSPGPQPEA